MTIKQAKQISRQIIGRLPKCGREVCVERGVKPLTLTQAWDGRQITGRFEYEIWLENSAGRYRVREYTSVNPV